MKVLTCFCQKRETLVQIVWCKLLKVLAGWCHQRWTPGGGARSHFSADFEAVPEAGPVQTRVSVRLLFGQKLDSGKPRKTFTNTKQTNPVEMLITAQWGADVRRRSWTSSVKDTEHWTLVQASSSEKVLVFSAGRSRSVLWTPQLLRRINDHSFVSSLLCFSKSRWFTLITKTVEEF